MSSPSSAVPIAASDVLDAPMAASEPQPAGTQSHEPPQPRCPNCGTPAADHYCPHCGQAQTDIHRSLRGIAGDLLDTFAGWDAKIPRTLLLLVRRPGELTADYLAGRRARYVPPLRLYLTLSIVFFLSLRVSPAELADDVSFDADTTGTGVRLGGGADSAAVAPATTARPTLLDSAAVARAARAIPGQPRTRADSAALDAFLRRRPAAGVDTTTYGSQLKRRFKHGMRRLNAMSSDEKKRALLTGFTNRAANMVFVLLPIFALLLRVLYVRSPFFYAEHFVFALHVHAMTMLAFTLLRFAPQLSAVRLPQVAVGKLLVLAILLWPPVYVYRAMRRVYGQSRIRTFTKYLVLGATYGVIVFVSSVLTVLLGVLLLD